MVKRSKYMAHTFQKEIRENGTKTIEIVTKNFPKLTEDIKPQIS